MLGMQRTMHSNDAEGAPCTPEAADILGDAMARPEAAGWVPFAFGWPLLDLERGCYR